ncbi:MAG: hypothetical protein ACAH80_18445, partial [Alphaproteobacteria bacterium]
MPRNRLDKLFLRRIDPTLGNVTALDEVYKKISQSESVKYALGAMQPIDPQYTKATFEQGDRVKNQLDAKLSTSCSFAYQGSVTNDTHIKAKSDLDLLTVIKKFHDLEAPQQPLYPYQGNPVQDMRDLRAACEAVLISSFPQAKVDTSGSKAIAMEGGSLTRKIDVVPASWHHTNRYAQTQLEIYKGVMVFDKDTGNRIPNAPFLHNYLIGERDAITRGGLRKASRLMKSLKYDADKVSISSYDIVAIAYNIEASLLTLPKEAELTIVEICHQYCSTLLANASLRASISVPVGNRKVFCPEGASEEGLAQLTAELAELRDDIISENSRSFTKLAQA